MTNITMNPAGVSLPTDARTSRIHAAHADPRDRNTIGVLIPLTDEPMNASLAQELAEWQVLQPHQPGTCFRTMTTSHDTG